MASFTEIIKGIRSKFVGTSDEHDLLRSLQERSTELENEIRIKIQEEYRELKNSLDQREMQIKAMTGDSKIDEALFVWFENSRTGEFADDWSFGYLIRAMQGRGLGVEHLEKILEAMKREKKVS